MKNILAAAAAAFLLITTTGCSDFLDEDLKRNWLLIIPIPAHTASRLV